MSSGDQSLALPRGICRSLCSWIGVYPGPLSVGARAAPPTIYSASTWPPSSRPVSHFRHCRARSSNRPCARHRPSLRDDCHHSRCGSRSAQGGLGQLPLHRHNYPLQSRIRTIAARAVVEDRDAYTLLLDRWAVADLFSATAARMSAFNAFSSILSPSWKSMARLVLPSRLELKR